MQKNNAYFFNTTDPQIYVDISGHEKSNFFFNMKVFALDETCSATIAEQSATIAEQSATIAEQNSTIAVQTSTIENLRAVAADFRCQLEQKIQQADIAIQKKQQELAALYASRSWRLTKPLRTLGGFARALFRR